MADTNCKHILVENRLSCGFDLNGERIMSRVSALFAGLLAGITSPASLVDAASYPRVEGSDLSRLRQDVTRVGSDFSNVIKRENGHQQKVRSKTPSGK